jgi:hypothetical protein
MAAPWRFWRRVSVVASKRSRFCSASTRGTSSGSAQNRGVDLTRRPARRIYSAVRGGTLEKCVGSDGRGVKPGPLFSQGAGAHTSVARGFPLLKPTRPAKPVPKAGEHLVGNRLAPLPVLSKNHWVLVGRLRVRTWGGRPFFRLSRTGRVAFSPKRASYSRFRAIRAASERGPTSGLHLSSRESR